MKTYEITFTCVKTVDDWDPENGAQGRERIVDQWSKTYETRARPTRNNLPSRFTDFMYERTGLTIHHDFVYWPDEPGRFTTSCLENAEGFYDVEGRYLADYDVRIEWRAVEEKQPLRDSLGLKSVNG